MANAHRAGWLAAAVLAPALALGLAACSFDDSTAGDADGSSRAGDAADDAVTDDMAGGAGADADAHQGNDESIAEADDAEAPAALPVGATDREGQHVIRQGRFTVVYNATFDESFMEVSAIAERLGGGVTGVTSETTEEGEVVGEATVRVPVDAYDRLLVDVAGVGEVTERHVTEEDVSGEVVDLRSRLRHLERQETFYLELFDQADGVSDAITIQGHLESVQQRKEQVQGRLDHLDDRTSMSTLVVRLVPEGHDDDHLGPDPDGFAGYWEDAVAAFVAVTGTLLVFAVGGAPLLTVAALAVAAAAVLLRAWRGRGVAGPVPSATMTGE